MPLPSVICRSSKTFYRKLKSGSVHDTLTPFFKQAVSLTSKILMYNFNANTPSGKYEKKSFIFAGKKINKKG